MNDIFNFRRFGKYYVSDIRNTFNNTWLTVLLTALSGLIAYLFCGAIHLLADGSWSSYGLIGRGISFFVLLYILVIVFPSKAYGFFTDKRRGGFYTLIPASSLEKFLAMFINAAILAPLVYIAIALAADGLLCLADPECGETLTSAIASGAQDFNELCSGNIDGDMQTFQFFSFGELIWGVILNLLGWTLVFLLGALYFKKNKIGKTILAMILFSMAVSLVITPMTLQLGEGIFGWFESFEDPEHILSVFKGGTYGLAIVNVAALSIWAYIRVRTVKH